jgi:hypothetical protein
MMHKVWRGVAVAAAAFALVATHAQAATTLIPGKISIVKVGKLAKLVSKPTVPPPFPVSPSSGSVQFFDTGASGGADSFPLNAGTWTGLGNPAGSKGWKYKGTKTPADPCVVVLIKETVIKAICKGASVTSGGTSFAGDIGVILNADGETYCAQIPPTTKNVGGTIIKGKDAAAPGSCPTVPSGCCGAERITLTSSAGTLTVDNLVPFPFPTGVLTVMDVGPADGACHHKVEVASGNFFVPNFDLPALNYCSSVTPIGCDVGTGFGAGDLWDGNAASGIALTNVLATGDTADGVCDPTVVTTGTCAGGVNAGLPCASSGPPDCPASTCTGGAGCTTATAGANTLGDIDRIVSASPGGGVRSLIDIPVHSLTWSDSLCSPASTPGCCPGSNYNPSDGDLMITEFDFILRPTTGVGTGQFADKNGNICKRAGSGFDTAAPGQDGPKSKTGSPAVGPCCTVGQATKVVSVGVGFSGGAPLFDLGFQSEIPNTVSACGAYVAPSTPCTPSTDPCQQ